MVKILDFFRRLFKRKKEIVRCKYLVDMKCLYPESVNCPKECWVFQKYRIHVTRRLPSGKTRRKTISNPIHSSFKPRPAHEKRLWNEKKMPRHFKDEDED